MRIDYYFSAAEVRRQSVAFVDADRTFLGRFMLPVRCMDSNCVLRHEELRSSGCMYRRGLSPIDRLKIFGGCLCHRVADLVKVFSSAGQYSRRPHILPLSVLYFLRDCASGFALPLELPEHVLLTYEVKFTSNCFEAVILLEY